MNSTVLFAFVCLRAVSDIDDSLPTGFDGSVRQYAKSLQCTSAEKAENPYSQCFHVAGSLNKAYYLEEANENFCLGAIKLNQPYTFFLAAKRAHSLIVRERSKLRRDRARARLSEEQKMADEATVKVEEKNQTVTFSTASSSARPPPAEQSSAAADDEVMVDTETLADKRSYFSAEKRCGCQCHDRGEVITRCPKPTCPKPHCPLPKCPRPTCPPSTKCPTFECKRPSCPPATFNLTCPPPASFNLTCPPVFCPPCPKAPCFSKSNCSPCPDCNCARCKDCPDCNCNYLTEEELEARRRGESSAKRVVTRLPRTSTRRPTTTSADDAAEEEEDEEDSLDARQFDANCTANYTSSLESCSSAKCPPVFDAVHKLLESSRRASDSSGVMKEKLEELAAAGGINFTSATGLANDSVPENLRLTTEDVFLFLQACDVVTKELVETARILGGYRTALEAHGVALSAAEALLSGENLAEYEERRVPAKKGMLDWRNFVVPAGLILVLAGVVLLLVSIYCGRRV